MHDWKLRCQFAIRTHRYVTTFGSATTRSVIVIYTFASFHRFLSGNSNIHLIDLQMRTTQDNKKRKVQFIQNENVTYYVKAVREMAGAGPHTVNVKRRVQMALERPF